MVIVSLQDLRIPVGRICVLNGFVRLAAGQPVPSTSEIKGSTKLSVPAHSSSQVQRIGLIFSIFKGHVGLKSNSLFGTTLN